MGLFYAYLKDDQSDSYRYLITFVNREAADEWWRMISTPPSPYAANVRRISPQFYTQDSAHYNNVLNFFSHTELPGARRFHRTMLITGACGVNGTNPNTLPAVTFTDHISGRWYFVRSKADPWSNWYLRISGACLVCGDANCDAIHVSSEHRTKFCVRAHLGADFQVPENFVMIGRDEISITARKDYAVHISDAEDLKATKGYQGGTDLLLADLKDRFIARSEKQVNGEIWEYVESVERGSGEAWELVD